MKLYLVVLIGRIAWKDAIYMCKLNLSVRIVFDYGINNLLLSFSGKGILVLCDMIDHQWFHTTPYLEKWDVSMVAKVFEPSKFDCSLNIF